MCNHYIRLRVDDIKSKKKCYERHDGQISVGHVERGSLKKQVQNAVDRLNEYRRFYKPLPYFYTGTYRYSE